MTSIYDISIHDINNNPLDLSQFKGKKMLIVNVASECGFTPQYAQLQELYENYSDKLEIVGVPCNDFGKQEPGSHQEIKSFCQKNYGVTFTITEKVSLYNPIHPLYEWLTTKEKNGVLDSAVEWNFHKFFINEEGKLLGSYKSAISPFDEGILNKLG